MRMSVCVRPISEFVIEPCIRVRCGPENIGQMQTQRLTRNDIGHDVTLEDTSPPESSPPPSSSGSPPSSSPPSMRRLSVLPSAALPLSSERFTFEARVGVGGEGEVWRVYDHDLGRRVAVKRAHRVDLHRFAGEVRTAGALEHPGIVPVHDVGVDDAGRPYFVMRFVDGESLEAIIARLAAGDRATHEHFCFERRIQIFRSLCEAVSFAHSRGILHGDIKPANVMVGRHGEVFLTDWGIARSIGGGPSGTIAGTPAYMSPEQAQAKALDQRSDVFSLSALLYELLTLSPYFDDAPFAGSLADVLRAIPAHRPRFPSDVRSPHQPAVPMDLGWFVMAGLATDREKRMRSVEAMLERLDRRAQGRVPIQCTQTFLKRVMGESMRVVESHPALLPLAIAGGVAAYAAHVLWPLLH